MGLDPLSWALLAVTAVSTGASLYQGQKATKYQKQANDFQRKQADLQNARQKRDSIRQARLAYANAQNAAANQGVMGSSSSEGGQSSILSQLSDNLSFLDQYGLLTDQASDSLGKAMTAKGAADMWGDIAGASLQAYSVYNGNRGKKK